MALPINIEDLLNKRKIEGNLIHITSHDGCVEKPIDFNSSEKNVDTGSEKSSEKTSGHSEKKDKVNTAILAIIERNPKVSAAEIAMQLGMSSRAIEKRIKALREGKLIRRNGPDKGGYWEIVRNE